MDISDFVKQPRDERRFDIWTAKQSIPTRLGEFTVDLQMQARDKTPPGESMIRQAEKLICLFRTHFETIHNMVFEHYRIGTEEEGWMDSCGVPIDLDRTGIAKYLQDRSLTVSNDKDDDGEPSCRVFITPDWDDEHAIFLAFRDGKWEFVDC